MMSIDTPINLVQWVSKKWGCQYPYYIGGIDTHPPHFDTTPLKIFDS